MNFIEGNEADCPWVFPEQLVEMQIIDLLRKLEFDNVVYIGRLGAYVDRSRTFLRYDAEFYDREYNEWFVPVEFSDSFTRVLMNEVVNIFVDNDIEAGTEISIDDKFFGTQLGYEYCD